MVVLALSGAVEPIDEVRDLLFDGVVADLHRSSGLEILLAHLDEIAVGQVEVCAQLIGVLGAGNARTVNRFRRTLVL